ncbi:hypothetical protein WR25_17163 [Diploscapter pachys]|uniref:Neurotransmitter-gated ion-channel ligand-binding domain-containing protein n=1 Tax=Diploscapter pachys TaxID=2018661 RepID=A0A2A2LDK2_9BILA|nr:hypothetical protein WR25_17163 [Diploscapter pachys]
MGAQVELFNATKISDPRTFNSTEDKDIAMMNIPLIRLIRDLLDPARYDVRVRPILDHRKSLKVHIKISLYQIIEVDEPAQNIKLNVWMIQKWTDEYLSWNPREYGMINSTNIPFNHLWIPDTYLYNSVTMSRDETERYMNIQVQSNYWEGRNGSDLSFLYPAIYTVTCRLNIRFFPYDRQNCTLTISSWTNSKAALDYYGDPEVSLQSFIKNEEWDIISFNIYRHEYLYACCPEPWVILQAHLVIQRKPLYYLVNLIIPTSIITLVSITGFFTPASTDDDRTEKINLGITTLLAMSILMLMVSDAMPTTSEFVPLIAWFYLSIIVIVSIGTFLTSVVLSVQSRRQYGKNPPRYVRYLFFIWMTRIMFLHVPPTLRILWGELDDDPINIYRRKKSIYTPRTPTKTGSYKAKPGSPVTSLRVPGSAGLDRDRVNSIQMIDVSTPGSPSSPTGRTSRTASYSKVPTLWEGTMSALAENNQQLRRTSQVFSKEVDENRKKRQCSLEWEFLATVLDRFLLIVFILAVLIVTSGLIIVGKMAQYSYDHPEDPYFFI